MGRRRRSLLGGGSSENPATPAPAAPPTEREPVPAPTRAPSPKSAGPFQLPEDLANAPEAALPSRDEPEDDLLEAVTVDNQGPSGAGSAPRQLSSEPAEERWAAPDLGPESDLDLEMEMVADPPAEAPTEVEPDNDIPHGGDMDSFADAETQMDEYGAEDELSGGVLAELDLEPEPEPPVVKRTAPAIPRSSGTSSQRSPVPRDQSLPALPPIPGLLDDDDGDYGGFGGMENPPTEEVEFYQDVTQRHNAPMNVPEPPPIPGIEDRFTPPPVERTEIGSRHTESRPSYLAESTPAPADRQFSTKRKDPSGGLVSSNRIPIEKDEDEEGPGVLRYLVLGVALVGLFGICGGGSAIAYSFMNTGGGAVSGTNLEDDHHGVRIERGGIKKDSPEYVGDIDEQRTKENPPPGEGEDSDGEEAGVPTRENMGDVPDPEPSTAPKPKPAPVVEKPKPQPQPVAKPEPVLVSKLKIRANRRVLVYVDGKAVGYTPLDYQVGVGGHEVVAMVSGKPESRQTKQAAIAKAGDNTTVEFSF